MADELKNQDDLHLPDEFDGQPVHLMTEAADPPTKPASIARVGVHYDDLADVEWFDVTGDKGSKGGTLAQAQAVIDGDVAKAAREHLKDNPAPVAPVVAAKPVVANVPLSSAQVDSQNKAAQANVAAKHTK